MSLSLVLCLSLCLCLSFSHCCTDSVRLVDGGSRCAGRVEVFVGLLFIGRWKGVCMYQWDVADAAVVCRELGCLNTPRIATFGTGSQLVRKGYPNCTGAESSLKNCFVETQNTYCDTADAGVICSGKLYF